MIKLGENLWINPALLIDITMSQGRTVLRYRTNDAGIANMAFNDMSVDEVGERIEQEIAKTNRERLTGTWTP